MQQKNKSKNIKALLDTSAIIALLKKEPGYEILEELISRSAISSVNLAELVSVLTRTGVLENEIDEIIKDIVPEIILFTEDIAIQTGKLIASTKEYGLSLGDRACIATGIILKLPIYSTDAIWSKLNLNCKINIIK